MSNQIPNLFPSKNLERISGNRTIRRGKIDPDEAVRNTDNDASIARFSAISKKYIVDEFTQFFVPLDQNNSRPPWVNIGTHHRTYVIDALVERFLEQIEGPKQVISLGSGSDSRYWRLKNASRKNWKVERWVETDFKKTVKNKIQTIMKNNQLKSILGDEIKFSIENLSEINQDIQPPTELHAKDYSLISIDLRQSDQFSQKFNINQTNHDEPFLKSECPTLIIAELVFLYMSPEQTKSCLEELSSIFKGTLMFITYEAMNLNDNFSKMMIQNLSTRGLSLPGFDFNCSIESQIKRFQEIEMTEIVSIDMKKLRDSNNEIIDEEWKLKWDEELIRIKKLEFLDEVEELELVLKHYAMSWAIRKLESSLFKTSIQFYLPKFSSIS